MTAANRAEKRSVLSRNMLNQPWRVPQIVEQATTNLSCDLKSVHRKQKSITKSIIWIIKSALNQNAKAEKSTLSTMKSCHTTNEIGYDPSS